MTDQVQDRPTTARYDGYLNVLRRQRDMTCSHRCVTQHARDHGLKRSMLDIRPPLYQRRLVEWLIAEYH